MHDAQRSKEAARRVTPCRVAVIWIDWYAYHVARFIGLDSAPSLASKAVGLELVGGVGVHTGLKFREELPKGLAIETTMPESSWQDADKMKLASMLWRRLSQLDPEVVLVPGYYTLPAIAAALWAKIHRRVSVLMTESTAFDHPRAWWKEGLKGLLLRVLFDWAVAGGQAHRQYLQQLRFPQERTVGFYDVVDNEFFDRGCRALGTSTARESGLPDNYFLYVGRFAEEKNVSGLLASWVRYWEDGGRWSLVLVGDGPEAMNLRTMANASGYGFDVHFPGLKSSRELLPFYAFARCFVLPSTREPWGLVVNEAMASGLPVLVSERAGCAVDLVEEGKNGFVFDPHDTSALSALLRRFEELEPDELSAMKQRSREIIVAFSPRRFGLEIERVAEAGAQRAVKTSMAKRSDSPWA